MAFLEHRANVSGLQADGGVTLPPSPHGVEPREVAMLAEHCAAALEARGTSVTSAERDREWLRMIGVTLVAAPPELGGETVTREMADLAARPDPNGADPSGADPNGTDVNGADANAGEEWPELRACRLWIACASGAPPAGAAAEFALLLDAHLWDPVRALVHRALSFFGRRRALASSLPARGPWTLVDADARLDAQMRGELGLDVTKEVAANAFPWPLADLWRRLLITEGLLAGGAAAGGSQMALWSLVDLWRDNRAPRTFEEAVARRLAIRAAATLARVAVSQSESVSDALTAPAALLMPRWERNYLQGLNQWQADDWPAATTSLREALRENPWQLCIRHALAALLAPGDPEAALEVLPADDAFGGGLAARRSLLARLGRLDDVSAFDEGVDLEPASEPARVSWPRGRALMQARALTLSTAIAERAGDWRHAERAWRDAARTWDKAVHRARVLWNYTRERAALGMSDAWRHDVLTRDIQRAAHELADVPLIGDALFFRAAAFVEDWPERAARDFGKLARQSGWLDAEIDVGGARVIDMSDALLRLGHVQPAIQLYTRLKNAGMAAVGSRLAVASVLDAVRQRGAPAGAGPERVIDAIDRASVQGDDTSWPRLIGALGLLVAGEVAHTRTALTAADAQGAAADVGQVLHALCGAAAGETFTPVAEETLAALRVPARPAAIVRLVCGTEKEEARATAFMHDLGDDWVAACPHQPAQIVRRRLAMLCARKTWGEVGRLRASLDQRTEEWARGLAREIALLLALQRAAAGELEEAERTLAALAASLESS
jgi:hypothetical protein